MEELDKNEKRENQAKQSINPEILEDKFIPPATVVFINNGSGNYHNSINSIIGKYESPYKY